MATVTLQYFDGCPHWHETEALLHEALLIVGQEYERIELQTVETVADAVRAGFIGSPTILIDGMDPFAVDGSQPGLACRLYSTPAGLRGCPTLEQLLTVLRR
ncbi:MAG: thioredoxin family protein [Candidatus Nanopelagicales bacterium]|nr:thioredoxin family protein [Candidatus Nanopelagicales bacterium]